MELEGVVHNGVIVPDDATALLEGTRVRITPAPPEKPRPCRPLKEYNRARTMRTDRWPLIGTYCATGIASSACS
jgi:hypothetical protein